MAAASVDGCQNLLSGKTLGNAFNTPLDELTETDGAVRQQPAKRRRHTATNDLVREDHLLRCQWNHLPCPQSPGLLTRLP